MAQLSSPGISVTVIDESFYTPAAPGTVPLIIVASEEGKMNSAGTGIAPGTLKANAGKVYLLTSQADLGATFGVPYFQTDSQNNPVHAGELNEYGLEAAYSFLGVSNRAYVVRADVNTKQLIGQTDIPAAPPADGTFWFDIADTHFGVFEWNSASATTTGGQIFSDQGTANNLSVITDINLVNNSTYAPLPSYGSLGDYAIVSVTNWNKLWFKKYVTNTAAGSWVEVGTSNWVASWPTVTAGAAPSTISNTDTLIINGTTVTGVTTVSALATAINTALTASGINAAVVNGYLNLYSNGTCTYSSKTNGSLTLSGTLTGSVGAPGVLGIVASSYLCPALTSSPHYQVPLYGYYDQTGYTGGAPTGSVWIKTTSVNLGANWFIKKYNEASATWLPQKVQLFANNQSALATLDATGGINLPVGTVYVKYNDAESSSPLANFKIYGRTGTGATTIVSLAITSSTFPAATYSFTQSHSQPNSSTLTTPVTVTFTSTGVALSDAQAFLTAFTAATSDANIVASLNTTTNVITISHLAGGDIRFVDGSGTPLAKIFSTSTTANYYADPTGTSNKYIATLWAATVNGSGFAVASFAPPTTTPADGTLWYNNDIGEVDIMVNNGTNWVGYLNYTQNAVGGTSTDPNGPIIMATTPTTQSDGTPLANGDLWINSSNLEMWPEIYKYNYLTKKWVLLDSTDQISGNGVVFADARWNNNSASSTVQTGAGTPDSIVSLLTSNYLDFDAPDPALYPKGILLYNLRRSSFNVKRYVSGYVNVTGQNIRKANEAQTNYYPDRWVSDAANDVQGVGQFGRKAQRAVVLQGLNALIQSNQNIRQPDTVIYNLLTCPGYLETVSELVGLNTDNGQTAFIVADSPARLTPDATSLSNWGNNTGLAAVDGEDGLIATDPYTAVYYPWGYTTDLLGNNIVVPPSHIMLRTIALSDNVSYPWFAPAGVRRGGVTNASSVGYVDGQTGEFVTVALNIGQRDTLAAIHVNPITYIAGTGLVCYGQKTRQLIASSLDRINVARLVIYLRYQLNQLAKPFVFEPNDTITRNEMKQQVEKLLLELTSERALYDYLVVCDTSNNTPARIDRNELYVDIAIEPVKAVEFIYIPLRLENTGAIKGLGK